MEQPFQQIEMIELRHWGFIERLEVSRSLKHYSFEGSYTHFNKIYHTITVKKNLESFSSNINSFDDVELFREIFLQQLHQLKKLKRLELSVSEKKNLTADHINILKKTIHWMN